MKEICCGGRPGGSVTGCSSVVRGCHDCSLELRETPRGGVRIFITTGRDCFLNMKVPYQKWNECRLLDVLNVPQLFYNLPSISKVTEFGNTTDFNENDCQIYNAKGELFPEG